MLGQAAGVAMTHVAYRGGAPAAQDLIGGQVPLMVDTASETIEHHKTGKVRILAVTGEQRNRALPEVPTLKEQGIAMAADAFFGLYGPPGMAAADVARIDRAVAEALNAPDVQERIYGFGLVPSHAPAAQLAATQAEHLRKWEAPIKASGFKAE
jgi:tripartite-type tricarboxylate transporter receptor subunit TctC